LGELTFGVGHFLLCPHLADSPRGAGGWSARVGFVPCSSCSCSPFVSIRRVFGFRLDGVSEGPQQRADGPRVPGGQSACSPQTVRGSRCATGGSVGFNGRSAAQAGQSAARVQTVRGVDAKRAPCAKHTASRTKLASHAQRVTRRASQFFLKINKR
jgi:hypothetical protein